MYRRHCHHHHVGASLLGGFVLAGLPVVLVAATVSALGWWTLALVAVLAFLWWCVGHWHRTEHIPGHTGADDGCSACQRFHRARYARLKAEEAERRRQADYARLSAEEARRVR